MDGRYHALIARSAATSRSKNGHVRGWSGYTPKLSVKADIPDGPFSATTGLMHCSKTACYSITSSASASSVDGTSIPSAFAILRLMLDVNLVGCSMGMSPGLVPLRILVDEIDGAAKDLDEVHAVTSEATILRQYQRPNRREMLLCGERGDGAAHEQTNLPCQCRVCLCSLNRPQLERSGDCFREEGNIEEVAAQSDRRTASTPAMAATVANAIAKKFAS
jgi:hypothetical protein